MATTSNVMGLTIFVSMLLSIPVIVAGVWLSTLSDNVCVGLLQWPVIILGMVILAVALAGFMGALWRIPWILSFHLAAMLVLVLLLTALVVFVYAVTSSGGSGHIASGRTYREYRLDDYSGWLRRRLQSSGRWERIKNCLSSTSACAELDQKYRVANDFFKAAISPIQSGCCKPPTACGFNFVNPTYWIGPMEPAAGEEEDCTLWNNNQTELCYACSSCKAGLLENLKREWRRADLILFLALLLLVTVYSTGYCVLRNAQADRSPPTGASRCCSSCLSSSKDERWKQRRGR